MNLIDKVKRTYLIENNDRIVVGVSGGPDSICLLSVLVGLKSEYNLSIFVAHVNHDLREEADFEEEYVKKLCDSLEVEFFSKKFDVENIARKEKRSTEEVARNLRYNFFNEIANKVDANKIAVAHNLNDNVETVLLNLIRGCGIDGLCGIQKENGKIIRPLIDVSREEIERYIDDNNLTVMHDKTNFETVYTRNKIRNELIPYLKKLNPEVVQAIYRNSQLMTLNKEMIKSLVKEKYDIVREKTKDVVLNKNKFLLLNEGLKREVLRMAISEFNGNLVDISMATIDNAISIISNSQSGSIVKITSGVKIKIVYEKLIFFDSQEDIEFCYELNIPGKTYIPEIGKTITTKIVEVNCVPDKYEDRSKCFFDVAKTGKKIYVRNKLEGDSFEPTGMIGKKTLKKFFTDLKIDINERKKIPIISNDTDIIWIVGFRTSRKFLKDKDTKEVIILEYGENI